MSGVVDVGDAVELTFSAATGADVEVSWLDPDQAPVFEDVTVAETPAGSGKFPYTFVADRAGVWTAVFRASGAATQVEQYWIRASAVTGPPPLAVVGDVTSQYGSLTPAQEGIAKWLLRAASAMVRSRFPQVDAQITAGLVDSNVVALGVTNMVLRVLRNPRGLRSETTGPFSRTYDTTAAAGLLVMTDEDMQLFIPIPVAPPTLTTAATIRVSPAWAPPPSSARCRW